MILPYPKHGRVDAILENMGDDTALEDVDQTPLVDVNEAGSDTESAEAEQEWEAKGPNEDNTLKDADDADRGHMSPHVPPAVAERVAHSKLVRAAYDTMQSECQQWGNMRLAHLAALESKKEERRIREMSRENNSVLQALAEHQLAQDAEDRKRQRQVDDANAQTLRLKDIRRQVEKKSAELAQKRRAIAEAEEVLQARQSMRTYSLGELGHGRSGGQAQAKKNRASVLDRLARCGGGLSPAQKNDFGWFKEAWDAAMSDEHKGSWPATFASWMQKVLDDVDSGDREAFSKFVHRETTRCFSSAVALSLPGHN